ncbi:MAG: GGDEF domain-containing protein, partial [Gemmatimonadaceae bacterium]
LFQRTVARHRATITTALDPARQGTSDVQLSLAREVGAIRVYLLTGDSALIGEYRLARAAQDRALTALAGVRGLDSAIVLRATQLDKAARDWNVVNDRLAQGLLTVAAATAELPRQQEKYSRALDATESLETQITNTINATRMRVQSLESWWARASMVLTVLAGAAALMVILMMRTAHTQSALARTDPLTGLYNRLGFDELATRELSRARRNGAAITLVSFDLDGFKAVNDRQGHAAGDQLLRSVGRAIRAAIRDIDVAARLGGDEFAVLLPDNRANPPERAVERIHGVIVEALAREKWPVTLSVGAVTVTGHAIGIDEMIHTSDTLMYRVKNAGKNAIHHEHLVPTT